MLIESLDEMKIDFNIRLVYEYKIDEGEETKMVPRYESIEPYLEDA